MTDGMQATVSETLTRIGMWAKEQGSYARIATLQGLFYVIGGFWPLADMTSFMAVTGPKTDIWLVNTSGLLIASIGIMLLVAALRTGVTLATILLAVLSATSLAAIEVYYVLTGWISPVYLLDTLAEAGIIYLWMLCGED